MSLIDINEEDYLVIACDSVGGIGKKVNDYIDIELDILGYFSTQVVLMELLSVDANIISIVNTISTEMESYGEKIINGISKAVESIGLDPKMIINGSTEENIPVTATGLGVVGIGIIKKAEFLNRKIDRDDLIISFGLPRVGKEIIDNEYKDIMTADKLKAIKEIIDFKEIVPIGSKGIKYEITALSKIKEFEFELFNEEDRNLFKSAGPSTVVMGIISKEDYVKLQEIDIYNKKIGRIK
ncbi:MAG: hypothetical protein Q4P31_04940 [Andreesenia angusta]|nr:hypothetical protein [Andreesenia angusta]